jgi:Got1/Sft2-like family
MSSVFDGNFDFRSLLPTRAVGSSSDNVDSSASSAAAAADDDDCTCCGLMPDGLSWRERLLGCGTCLVAGYILSLGAFWRLVDLAAGDPYPFVMNATIGNMIALAGSFFLSGPKNQWRRMWHDKRRTATILYLSTLFGTFFIAIISKRIPGPKAIYLIILILAQYVAIFWYILTYIPFANDMISQYIRRRLSRGGSGTVDDF